MKKLLLTTLAVFALSAQADYQVRLIHLKRQLLLQKLTMQQHWQLLWHGVILVR